MYWLFGDAEKIDGVSSNKAGNYIADDTVSGSILFKKGIIFSGDWCFCANESIDHCVVTGSRGKISFSFFGIPRIELVSNNKTTTLNFEPLQHVQQPMIEKIVQYFLGKANNPCTGEEGAEVMRWMEEFVCKD